MQTTRLNLFHENVYGEFPESSKVRYGAELKRIAVVLDGL
jgi:glutathione S-transferase